MRRLKRIQLGPLRTQGAAQLSQLGTTAASTGVARDNGLTDYACRPG
jgi:hypothetical protein